MTAIIRPIGALKKYLGTRQQAVVESGITIRQALIDLNIPPEIVALVLVNDKSQNKAYIIQNDDEIKLIAVLGGG